LPDIGLTSAADVRGVLTLTNDLNRAGHLLASIVAISEQTCKLVLDAALEAARADACGNLTIVVEQVCRLAVGAGVATGEIAWLVGELATSTPDADQHAEAGAAIAGLQISLLSMSHAVQELADSGAPAEIAASADALCRSGLQLDDLIATLV
jgi:methyl-accepting chemotaxis protein